MSIKDNNRLTFKNKKGEWCVKNTSPEEICLVNDNGDKYYVGYLITYLAKLEDLHQETYRRREMTDKEIEKALKLAISDLSECAQEQNRLKANIESVAQSFTRMETLYKIKCNELEIAEAKLQINLEAAYEHNTEECKRCMDKVEVKQQCAEDALKEQIRKETAREIFKKLLYVFYTRRVVIKNFPFDSAEENRGLRNENEKCISEIETLAAEYGVEVKK